MENKLLHTPEGFRDIYGEELMDKLALEMDMLDIIHSYGYSDIQTPSVEYFDVFSSRIGTTPSNELYKFFDKEGNTLVLRPDFTPSIARAAAKYFKEDDRPMRFCYIGNAFINTSDLQGRLKETTQIGAELLNDESAYADEEMLSIIVSLLYNIGLDDFQISLGNVEFFKGMCEEYGIAEDYELELRQLISNKNYFGAKAILDELSLSDSYKENILAISELFGDVECIKKAGDIVTNKRSLNALERLLNVYDLCIEENIDEYISFDLGMLSKYNYYTGIIFRAYTYGTGDAIVKGGRYDNLLKEFGKDAPAIGFTTVTDQLLPILIGGHK